MISNERLMFIAAQEAHAFIAFSTALLSFDLLGTSWIACTFLLIIALYKEIAFDPTHEVKQPFLYEGLTDFSFYVLGVGIGLFTIRLLYGVV